MNEETLLHRLIINRSVDRIAPLVKDKVYTDGVILNVNKLFGVDLTTEEAIRLIILADTLMACGDPAALALVTAAGCVITQRLVISGERLSIDKGPSENISFDNSSMNLMEKMIDDVFKTPKIKDDGTKN